VKKIKVLFVCARNGVQSPMAEGLLNAVDSAHFEVVSAGVERGDIHPLTVEVMREVNIDLEGRATKAAQDVSRRGFDFVITLCDRSRTECPKFQEAEVVHWQFHNPLAAVDHTNQKRMFRSLRDQIAQRIRLFALVQVRFTGVATSAHRFATSH
jgi:protein-tyrosine-phosphatase